jgi:NAD(P)-dependent dehydrogenase (short-subunit alcohol dehydrogenase family)
MDLGLDGDVALVTASSRGLGYACAEALAREGADVTVCGTSAEPLAAAEAALEDVGDGDVLARQADLTDPHDVGDLVAATVDAFGGLDHVDMADRDWYAAFDMLVMSHVWTLREAHPHLVESDAGSVVSITSTSVAEPIDDLVLSNAVRRAVLGSVKTVAREWAPDVRANVVMPGAHETGRIQDLIEQAIDRGEYDSYQEGLDDWADPVPMGRIGDPAGLGDVVAVLASERAAYVTGVALPVDGGRTRS